VTWYGADPVRSRLSESIQSQSHMHCAFVEALTTTIPPPLPIWSCRWVQGGGGGGGGIEGYRGKGPDGYMKKKHTCITSACPQSAQRQID
jgi:hypothetical protein